MAKLVSATTTLLLGIGLLFGPASGLPVTFVGEDLNLAATPELTRLTLHPTADASQREFLGMLETNVGIQDFESFADGTSAQLVLTFPGAGTATLNGNGSVKEVPINTDGTGRFPISGNKYWNSSNQFSITFSDPDVVAFGFYGIDFGDFNGQVTLDLIRANGSRTTVAIPHTVNGPGGSVIYFGVIDQNPFVGLQFGNTSPGFDVFGFDDMTIASRDQVPEPPSVPAPPAGLLLVAGALLGLSWAGRKESTSTAGTSKALSFR